jgi:hypothetical protein
MRSVYLFLILGGLMLLLTYCNNYNKGVAEVSPYLNQNDTVGYVGMATCKLCHADQHATFVHTGMGLSFDNATKSKSAATFGAHAVVYDSVNNFYYKPFWKGETLHIMEYRLDGKDTIHRRTEAISYIIGSGQHTNSHLLNINGYVYQAPITFYTQKQQWDLAPGMEMGFNSRFSRIITAECMTCHNGLPEMVTGAVNKYKNIPVGIDCERCHGPGELHVARVSNNVLVDTSKEIDYSIVNPRKLSVELQNNLCMRCHLQGVNVLNEGASFFDFKPGDKINEHWNVFLPKFDGKNDKFLMASQADRMVQSKCYLETKQLSCITCHNPHITVKATTRDQFNAPCKSCHAPNKNDCTEVVSVRKTANDDCSGCHIPKSGAIDIPHVSISDHKIQIPGKNNDAADGKFIGLSLLTSDIPKPLLMARGYLHYFESFNSDKILLDSAKMYLDKVDDKDISYQKVLIHYYYLKGDFKKIIETAPKIKDKKSFDAWTAYRVGEAYQNNEVFESAVVFYGLAVEQEKFNLDFNFKLATAHVFTGNVKAAEQLFNFIITENPTYQKAWNNLGVIQAGSGRFEEAENSLLRAVQLDPDYVLSRLKLAELYIQTRQRSKAREVVTYLERYHSNLPEVAQLSLKLRSI